MLRGLEEASLLGWDGHGRYFMHDLIRRYATDTAYNEFAAEVREAALRRVADFYLHTAYSGDRVFYPHRLPIELAPPVPGCHPHPLANYADALAWFDIEHPNILATQQTTLDHGWHAPAWQLAWALSTFHWRRGHVRYDHTAWQTGLAAAIQSSDLSGQSRAHRSLGFACIRLNRPLEALNHLQRALTIAEDGMDLRSQARTHRVLAQAWANLGNDVQALEHAAHALRLARSLAEQVWEAEALNLVGRYSSRLGRYDQARAPLNDALTLFQYHHDPDGEAATRISRRSVMTGASPHAVGTHTRIAWGPRLAQA